LPARISWKFRSYKTGIVASGALNVLGSIFGFVTNMAIAYFFGTKASLDVYFFCLATASMAVGLFVTSMNGAVVIPQSMHLAEQRGERHAMMFLNFFLYVYVILGVVIAAVFWSGPLEIFSSISSFKQDVLRSNADILKYSALLFLLMLPSAHMLDILASRRLFTVPAIASIANNCLLLLFLFVLHNRLDVFSLVVGLVVANALQIFFLVYLMVSELQWNFGIAVTRLGKSEFKDMLFAQTGYITSNIAAYIPLPLLSGFGPGTIASFNYGQRVANMPNTFVINPVSSITGLKLNELKAREDVYRFNTAFLTATKALLIALVPCSTFMFVFNREVIVLLFQRGEFDQDAVLRSAEFLKYLSLLLPFYAVNTMVSRAFVASRKVVEISWYQLIFNVILIVLSVVSVKLFGPIGYVWAFLFLFMLGAVAWRTMIARYLPFLRYAEIEVYSMKVIGSNVALAAVLFLVQSSISPLSVILSVGLGLVITLTTTVTLAKVFLGHTEYSDLIGVVKEYLRGRSLEKDV
jgi:putative peptidoglycan lipid II flippase